MLRQMCSNRAIVDSLECCMDDVVECFEDFIRKSLMLIFLGIGVIVGLLCYLLKMVSERPPLNNGVVIPENTSIHTRNKVNNLISNKKAEQEMNENIPNILKEHHNMKTDKIDNNLVTLNKDIDKNMNENKPTINKTSNPMLASFDENVLQDVGLSSCSQYGCGGGCSTHIYIPSRVPVPSLPTSSSKHKLIPCLRKRSLNRSSIPSLQICPKIVKPGSCCSMCCYDEPKKNDDSDGHKQ